MSEEHNRQESAEGKSAEGYGRAIFNGLTLLVSVAALVLSILAYHSSNKLNNLQISSIEDVINNTPSGTITSLKNNTSLPHDQPPFQVWAHIQHVPVNGDIWLIVHKPFDASKNNDPDRYYPTPAEYKGSGRYEFANVFIGTPQDTESKTYGVGLYFCDSVTNTSLETVVGNSKLRNEGMAFLSPGCQSMDSISVTRDGPP
jgi:chemotaxis protein CheY-P-specific phosphatase CheC